jgi:hypothetical protein
MSGDVSVYDTITYLYMYIHCMYLFPYTHRQAKMYNLHE